MENSLTVIFVPGAWFASRLLKSKIRLLISIRDPLQPPYCCFIKSPTLLWRCSCELCSHSLTHSRDGRESFTVMQDVLKRMPQSTSVTPPPHSRTSAPKLGALRPGSRLGPPSIHSWTVDPGSSLVSVCQRSTFWPLFFRQSIQCCKVSPCEWQPKDTPPGRGMRGEQREEKRWSQTD